MKVDLPLSEADQIRSDLERERVMQLTRGSVLLKRGAFYTEPERQALREHYEKSLKKLGKAVDEVTKPSWLRRLYRRYLFSK